MTVNQEDLAGVIHPGFSDAPSVEPVSGEPIETPVAPKRGRGRPRKITTETGPSRPTVSVKRNQPKPNVEKKPDLEMPPAGVIADGIGGLYTFIGMGISPMRPQTGMAIVANSADLGKAWEAAAAQNPAIRKALLAIMQTSTVGVLVAAHVPIVIAAMNESKEIKAAKEAALSEAVAAGPHTAPDGAAPTVERLR